MGKAAKVLGTACVVLAGCAGDVVGGDGTTQDALHGHKPPPPSSSSSCPPVTSVSADTIPPTFAGATSATATSSTITINWNAASDNVTPASQMYYYLYRSLTPGGEYLCDIPTGGIAGPGVTSYTVGTHGWDGPGSGWVVPGTTYYYIVRAVDGAGNQDSNTHEVSVTVP